MTRFWATAFLFAASAVFVNAQVAEFGLGGGVTKITPKAIGGGYSLDDGWHLAFRLTVNNWVFMGQEFGYLYNRSKLLFGAQNTGGMAIHQGFYNFLIYATPEGKRVRPFATGGGHFANFVPPGSSATQGGGENKFGVNYGAGVKFRVTDKWLFRVDFRQNVQSKPFQDIIRGPGGQLRINQIGAGLSFTM